jgi:hypothetical protein
MKSGERTFRDVSNELYASLSVPVGTKTMGKGSVMCVLLVFALTLSGTVITQNNDEVSAIRRFK